MKFKVSMKDPDTLSDAIEEALARAIEGLAVTDEEERQAVAVVRREKVSALCAKWFEYGEYLTVEIDTDAGTCTVVPLPA